MRHCSICKREVDENEAPILAMGGFGNPKYLCAECAEDIDDVIGAKEPEKIELSMAKISGKLSESDTDDMLVAETIKEIFSAAGERAKKIRNGTYDFSEDETEKDEITDIPEELLETEEDKARDEREAKAGKLYDKIFNWVALAAFLAVIVIFIINFVT